MIGGVVLELHDNSTSRIGHPDVLNSCGVHHPDLAFLAPPVVGNTTMLLLGLTGSIATGKSTVSSILSSPPYSLPVIDADKIARQVVEPGTKAYNAVVSHFASSTPELLLEPTESGERALNRPALGRRVFGTANESDRKILNSIVHPAVRREIYRQIAWAYFTGSWAVVLDVPLLYESGWEMLCGCILVVGVQDPTIQMTRLMARDEHLTREDAERRVSSQWDVRDKAKRCLARGPTRGRVVWNDGNKDDLKEQMDKVMRQLKRSSPRWWAWALLSCPPLSIGAALWTFAANWLTKRRWESGDGHVKAKL